MAIPFDSDQPSHCSGSSSQMEDDIEEKSSKCLPEFDDENFGYSDCVWKTMNTFCLREERVTRIKRIIADLENTMRSIVLLPLLVTVQEYTVSCFHTDPCGSTPRKTSSRLTQGIFSQELHKRHRRRGGLKTVSLMMVLAVCPLTSANNQLHFTQGAPGSITFDASWNSGDGFLPYFTIEFESASHPFCTLSQRDPKGFKSLYQYDRFRVSYTVAESDLQAKVGISDLSTEDAGVYIMTLTTDGGSTITVVKDVEVSPPPGEAQCYILKAPEGYSNHYAYVSCRAVAGRGNITIACYQDGIKIPYMETIHKDGIHVYGNFWMKSSGSPVHCCSHNCDSEIDQSTCLDFVWSPQESATMNSLVIASSEDPKATPHETSDSVLLFHTCAEKADPDSCQAKRVL